MKIAIMQPYFLPYIGYWQLLHAVDKFVILDDVNYIVRGYINRNRILLNGKSYQFTIPIRQASQNRLIKDTKLNFGEKEKRKILLTISSAYKKAPYYFQVMPLLEEIFMYAQEDLTTYIQNSLRVLSDYLEIDTEIHCSSMIKKDNTLRSQDRIIEICKKMQADNYINPCGGRSLYTHEAFEKENIELFFLDTLDEHIVYNQGIEKFEKNLSIIDVMMFNEVKTIKRFLNEYMLNK